LWGGHKKVEEKVKSETLRRKLLVQTRRWAGVGTGYTTKREYKKEKGKEIVVIRKSV
jgi:hypothetical protein